jgi:hypothetical protein
MDEIKHEHHEHKDSACRQSCCHYWGKLSKFWKIFVSVVIVLVIFVAGIGVGVRCGHFREKGWGHEKGQFVMMGYYEMNGRGKQRGYPFAQPGMMGRVWNQNPANGIPQLGQDQLSGTITKIEGNRITITDNAGKEQVILSQSDTSIKSSTGPVSLTNLKTGANITAVGTLNATTKQLEAKWINVN